MLRLSLNLLVAGWSLMALAGCGTGKPLAAAMKPPAEPVPELVWPSPPDPPRITYLRSFSRPADVGAKVPALHRFVNWLTGANKGDEPLLKPFGLALDENDNLCLTDTGANVVCWFDRARMKWLRWDRAGQLRFVSPVAVAKRQGTIYVADSGLASILAFNERGKLLFQITNRLERPAGLAVLGDRLWVADAQQHRLFAFSLAGQFISEIGRRGTGPGEFNFPTHLAADPDGTLCVTDSMNSRVQRFDAAGNFQGAIGSIGDSPGHFSRPKGVASDSQGHLYVVDGNFDNVQIFDRSGRILLGFGEAGTQPGQFWLPNGIAISRQNEIFVADSYNRRVQVFKYIGQP